MRMFSPSNPLSSVVALRRFTRNSAAHTSSTIDSAICATTSPLLVRERDSPAGASPLSAGMSAGRVDCSAGAIPNSMPVTTVTPNANPSTIGLSLRSGLKLTPIGSEIELVMLMAHIATSSPATPDTIEKARLSTSNCRTSALRFAPSASRMAISRARSRARARNRLATFTQAMISRMTTTAITTADSPTCAERNIG